jgi:hypothetical protein
METKFRPRQAGDHNRLHVEPSKIPIGIPQRRSPMPCGNRSSIAQPLQERPVRQHARRIEAARHAALADIRRAGNCGLAGIEPPGLEIEKIEDETFEHARAVAADRPVLPSGLSRHAFESAGLVPDANRLLFGQGVEFHIGRGAVVPHRRGGIGAGQGYAGAAE